MGEPLKVGTSRNILILIQLNTILVLSIKIGTFSSLIPSYSWQDISIWLNIWLITFTYT
jgi:hypothetical protein